MIHLSEATKQKNRERNKKHYHENKQYYKDWCVANVGSRLASVAKCRAKKRGIEFSITKDDYVVLTHCPILGIELVYNQDTGAGGKDNSFSLDRIDPTKGYVKGNVQVISHKANSMKFTATKEELLLFAKWVMETYK